MDCVPVGVDAHAQTPSEASSAVRLHLEGCVGEGLRAPGMSCEYACVVNQILGMSPRRLLPSST